MRMTDSQTSNHGTMKMSQVSPERDRESSFKEGNTFSADTKKVAFASSATDMGQGVATGPVTSPMAMAESKPANMSSHKEDDADEKLFGARDSGKRGSDDNSSDDNAASFARRQTLNRIKTMKIDQLSKQKAKQIVHW